MLKHLTEERQYLEITGFRNVNIEKPEQLLKAVRGGKQKDVNVQFFNASLIATWEHLYFAVLDALMAFGTRRNISKSIAVEAMLYSSAQRQIKKAIELIGVKNGCSDVAVIVLGESRKGVESVASSISEYLRKEPEESVLELSPEKEKTIQEAFGITRNELAITTNHSDAQRALVDIVIERMALLSTLL